MSNHFLPPTFNESNGLFYHPTNDITQNKWVKLKIEDDKGDEYFLTMSNYELNILAAQIRAIQAEHNWPTTNN